MRAQAGDRIRITGHHVGEHVRSGHVVEARGPDGTPPWVVRWDDSEHDCLFFPGPDAAIEHVEATRS